MSPHEWIALGYLVYIAGVALRRRVPGGKRARALAGATVMAGVVVVSAYADGSAVVAAARDWAPLLYIVAGYWLPGLLVMTPDERFESALLVIDRHWLGAPRRPASRLAVEYLEFSYLFCYPLVPIGFLCLYLAGIDAEFDRFWTAVLLAVFPCYGLLPWLPTRPPRMIESHERRSTVRRLNLWVLERASVQLNTFPSGHVASAIATVLVVAVVLPLAGLALAVIAVGITIGSVVGRYHYLADVVAGVAIAIVAFWVARLM